MTVNDKDQGIQERLLKKAAQNDKGRLDGQLLANDLNPDRKHTVTLSLLVLRFLALPAAAHERPNILLRAQIARETALRGGRDLLFVEADVRHIGVVAPVADRVTHESKTILQHALRHPDKTHLEARCSFPGFVEATKIAVR